MRHSDAQGQSLVARVEEIAFSMGADLEARARVKLEAARLLEKEAQL